MCSPWGRRAAAKRRKASGQFASAAAPMPVVEPVITAISCVSGCASNAGAAVRPWRRLRGCTIPVMAPSLSFPAPSMSRSHWLYLVVWALIGVLVSVGWAPWSCGGDEDVVPPIIRHPRRPRCARGDDNAGSVGPCADWGSVLQLAAFTATRYRSQAAHAFFGRAGAHLARQRLATRPVHNSTALSQGRARTQVRDAPPHSDPRVGGI